MASKESLENLLGSFTIFLDKPFTVGDVVTVGTVTGTIEKVGFRSTRIKTFDRSIVTVPNKKMIDAELDNLGLRSVRRVKFHIGLTYETPADSIKKIVADIQTLIDEHPKTNQEGIVKFQEFGSSSLDILILYFVDSPLWEDLVDVKEDINFKIDIKKNKGLINVINKLGTFGAKVVKFFCGLSCSSTTSCFNNIIKDGVIPMILPELETQVI